MGEKLRSMIEKQIDEKYEQLTEASKTLGKAGMPEIFPQIVGELRRTIASEFQVEVVGDEELQGPLIQKISQELGDPDTEVTRWVLEKSTPLGIQHPIVPCGVSPTVDVRQASDETDHWASPWKIVRRAP